MGWDKEKVAQLQLPDPADADPHPRLLLEGDGVHAGHHLRGQPVSGLLCCVRDTRRFAGRAFRPVF